MTLGRTSAIAAMSAALMLLVAACGGDDAGDAGDSVAIGLLNPVTGPFAALGEDVNDGFELYLDQQDGRLSGYEVRAVKEDEANDAAVATENAEHLVEQEDVAAIIGFVNSGVAYGASTYIRETGVPLIISVAGADDLTQRDAADNIFRVSYTGSSDAMPGGTYACEELGHETAAVVGLDYAFGWEGVGGFSRAFEDAGCEVLQELYVPLDTANWGPFVQQLRDDVDVVWMLGAGPDAIRFVQAYRDFRGREIPLMTHGSAVDEEVLVQQQDDAVGIISTLHYSRVLGTPENEEFVELFEETYGRTVSRYAEAGWVAAMVLEQALASVDEVDYESLIAAIAEVEVDAPRGPVSFDDYGQAIYNIYVREVEEVDGTYQNTVVETIPDVTQFWTYDPETYLDYPPYSELVGTWGAD